MKRMSLIIPSIAAVLGLMAWAAAVPAPQAGTANPRAAELQKWGVHDETRPMPPVVDPGPAGPPPPTRWSCSTAGASPSG